MRKLVSIFTIVTALACAQTSFADMGDMGDMGDMNDMGASDMAGDMAVDMTSDMSPADMPADMVVPDMAVDMATDMTSDTGDMADADMNLPQGPFTFDGVIELQGTPNWSGSLLLATNESETVAATTLEDGLFSLSPLPPGTYAVEISRPGYVTMTDEIILDADTRRRYVLFRDASAQVDLQVDFAAEAPSSVDLSFVSQRDTIEETVAVSDGLATWSGELAADTWTITASAEGYLPTTYQVSVDDTDQTIRVRLYQEQKSDVTTSEECACRSLAVERTVPGTFIFLLLAVFGWRRRNA